MGWPTRVLNRPYFLGSRATRGFIPDGQCGSHEFAFIIWVVVSKELNVEKIQKDIGKRLGLSWEENESNNETRARDIYKVLSRKKFMLLFDDTWKSLDLEMIGIPHPNSHNKSKDIPALAMRITKECKGLPLALITIGRAMACKKTPQEWEHAISVLSKSKPPSEISGMDDEMLLHLKYSYDNLGGDMIKSY
ncbi:disease resistance protein RPS5-like [Magnolia sinica]|uniref:disease resistance protein RPS5-like n=1 Tax=Magnolia sinica TaxID=86752 RepID=UPI00265A3E4D|nr:disease resistance protein RPS5-like [Magnolia sinica]